METLPTEPLDRGLSSRAKLIIALAWSFMFFALLATGLRVYVRLKIEKTLALDDWIMFIALVFHILAATFLTLASAVGIGYQMFTMTIDQIIEMTFWAWWTVPCSILSNVIARISITIVLVQIFGVRIWFKRLIITFTSVMSILGLANFVFIFFQVSPLEASWNLRVQPNWRLSTYPHSVLMFIQLLFFTISDFLFAFFPVLYIWRLQMLLRKKVGLMLVMAGSLVTMGASIGRLVITRDTLTENTNIDADAAMNADRIFLFFGVGSLLASIEVSLVILLGSLPRLKIITKLSPFQSITSSFNSLLLRFSSRSATQSGNSSLGRGIQDLADSDVELVERGKPAFNHQLAGVDRGVYSVQGKATPKTSDSMYHTS